MLKKSGTFCLACAFIFATLTGCEASAQDKFAYPPTPFHPVVDTIFGNTITDNYRWIEDVNKPEVQAWLKQQTDFTNGLLDKIPGRKALLNDYKKLDQANTVEMSFAIRKAGRYFYIKTGRGENVGKLYYRQGETGKEIMLFNPNAGIKAQSPATPVTFWFIPSNNGKKVALSLAENGKADIRKVKFLNVDTRTLYSDSLYPVSSPQAWTPDSKSFIYGELQTQDQLSPTFFLDIPLKVHCLGKKLTEDKVLLSRTTHPELNIKPSDLLFVSYSPDYTYLILELWSGPQEQIRRYYAAASGFENSQLEWKPLTKPEDQVSSVILHRGKAYLITRKDAPNRKVIASPLDNFDIAQAKTIVPETEKPIQGFAACRDFLFVQKTGGINSEIEQYNFATGEMKKVTLPQRGSLFPQTFDALSNDCIIWLNSWKQPTVHYRYDPLTSQSTISRVYPNIVYPGTGDLVVEEVEVKS